MEPSNGKPIPKRHAPRTPNVDCLVDARCDVAEGLVWDDRAHRVFWVDTPAGQIFAVSLTSGVVQSWTLPCAIGAIALCRDSRVIVALLDGFYLFDLGTHDLHYLCALDAPRDNDGLSGSVGPDGAFWLSGLRRKTDRALLRVAPDGTTSRITETDILASSGLGWSADGRTMYGADPDGGWLGRWAFDPATGDLSHGSRFVTRGDHLSAPAGGAVDIEGAYWSCDAASGCISRFSLSGELMVHIRLPVPALTACCFGGADLRLLLVASRRAGLMTRTLSESPTSGGIFMIPVDVPGVRVRRFQAAVR